MCGRYAWITSAKFKEIMDLQETEDQIKKYGSTYNAAPGMSLPIVVKKSPNHLELMRWGLIPPWAKDIRIGFKMINCRSETITEKVSYKRPFKNKRCVVPMSGFFEWHTVGKEKTPYWITLENDEPMAVAGLYEIAHDGEGKELISFTVITTAANEFMSAVHERMPVILDPKQLDSWLDNTQYEEAKLIDMLRPYKGKMKKVAVSKLVNSASNQGEEIIQPV